MKFEEDFDQLSISKPGSCFSFEQKNLEFHKPFGVNPILSYRLEILSWWQIHIVHTLPNVFICFQDIKLSESTHATFKMGKCEESQIPTCMLDNKANLLFISCLPVPLGSAWPTRCSTILAKNLLMSANSNLLRQNSCGT